MARYRYSIFITLKSLNYKYVFVNKVPITMTTKTLRTIGQKTKKSCQQSKNIFIFKKYLY